MRRRYWLNRWRRDADDKWRVGEQAASLLASRLAVIGGAEVASLPLGVRHHISTSGRR